MASLVLYVEIYLEGFAKYVDKYEVRQYVKRRIGSQYLVPLIGVYQKVEDIDVKSLPNAFVMKATHGSNWIVIVKDKREGIRIGVNIMKIAFISTDFLTAPP